MFCPPLLKLRRGIFQLKCVWALSAAKLKTSVLLSSIATTCGAAAAGSLSRAIVLFVGHILFWQNHVLEVKLNRLLDESRLWVTDADIDA